MKIQNQTVKLSRRTAFVYTNKNSNAVNGQASDTITTASSLTSTCC